jgi:predicted molibdopterin-dependent oxidoreductase YjgC
MEISTDSATVRQTRKMVFEFLATSVDLSLVDTETREWMDRYEVDADRYGRPLAPEDNRDARRAGHHRPPDPGSAENVIQPVKVHDELYVRDYAKCILCYRCVEACGPDAQNTFAIQVSGRGFDARISTEFDVDLTESACVYCGNCVGVCPTGALMFRSEYELRAAELWDEQAQAVTRTVCSFCGVGCNLDLHVQDNRIVKVTSPMDHEVTSGNLCIKGRFGYDYVQELGDLAVTPIDVVLASVRLGGHREADDR